MFQWDCDRGLLDGLSQKAVKGAANEIHDSPEAILSHILSQAMDDNGRIAKDEKISDEGHLFMLLDFHLFFEGSDAGSAELQRKFKRFSEITSVCCIIIIAPVFNCPASLEKEFTLVDFPFPSKDELAVTLDKIKAEITMNFPKAQKSIDSRYEDLLHAARGLTLVEAENAYALSLIKTRDFDIPTILGEKKQLIRKSGILEFRDSRFTFDDVGGLDCLRDWLETRKLAFTSDARAYGLPAPKGVLLIGIPGTGKSMSCDAVASLWEMPLLKLDMGAVFSAHVGESEQNMRRVIQTSEAVAPCVLWIDEIEKGIGGVQSSNQTDGGVTNRVFGTLLTWMQEKQTPVFVICTANNILAIPPEFMRAGRFDEIFFLDLPDEGQRKDVTARLLLKNKRDPANFDIDGIAHITENYSPAEIEMGISNGMFVAFSDGGRAVTSIDIISEMKKFQPLYNSRREDIEGMRQWALGDGEGGGRARKANSVTEQVDYSTVKSARSISISDPLSEDDL